MEKLNIKCNCINKSVNCFSGNCSICGMRIENSKETLSAYGLMDLNNYEAIEYEDLKKVSFIYDKINNLICGTDSIHEDLIEYMLKPFEDILKHHGVNLSEQNF